MHKPSDDTTDGNPPKQQTMTETEHVEDVLQPTETTSLLPRNARSSPARHTNGKPKPVDEVNANDDEPTWRHESAVIVKSSLPLIVTFFLQFSLIAASLFSVGHLGKVELGGVSLGMMSANISGLVIYQGMATSLDTLCTQAYGSGKKELVGLYVQRMVALFSVITVPIALLWFFSGPILSSIVPEDDVALIASQYLRVLIIGTPGYFCFECGKRFMQAQGLFSAATYVMLVVAPLNVFMNWFFVWKLQWGFIGAPIAVAISYTLLPIGLFLYIYFIDGSQCWGGFSKRAFSNWRAMIGLALPGCIMLEAEFCAFEILTFAASHLDTESLAANAVLNTVESIMFQVTFPLSVAGTTRVGNLVGASRDIAAKLATKVTLLLSLIIGIINLIILVTTRYQLPYLLNSDPDVVRLTAHVMPVIAAFQVFDSLATNCNGVIRGVGRQKIASFIQLFSYYAIGLPISFVTAFKLNWGLLGLWSGILIALGLVFLIEVIYIFQLNWKRVIDSATQRNAVG